MNHNFHSLYLLCLVLALVAGSASSAAESAQNASAEVTVDQLMLRGQQLLDSGKLDESMAVFEQVLAMQPGFPDALYQQGVILVRKNEFDRGITLIERAASLAPENVVYRTALASMYEFTGKLDAAMKVNNEIMALTDSGSQDYKLAQRNVGFISATLLARQGKLQQAEQQFNELAARYPDDFMIRYSLGVAQMLQDRLEEAQISLEKAREINPDYANTNLSLATLYEKQGHLDLAYQMLSAVVGMDVSPDLKKRARVRMGIIEGRLLMEEGNVADALDVLSSALELDPENPELLFELGLIYERMSDWAGVIDVSQRFLRLVKDRPDVQMRLAKAYVNTREYYQAAEIYQHIIDSVPGAPQAADAQRLLQRLLASPAGQKIAYDQREKKIEELQKKLAAKPDDIETLRVLATLLLQQQRWEEARIVLEKLLPMEPTSGLTHTSLALAYDRLGLYEKAIGPYAYGISLEYDPDVAAMIVPSLLMVTAKALYGRGDLSDAGRIFSQLVSMQPGNAEARFYLGLIYFNQDQFLQAIDAFQRVLQYVPEHVGARIDLAMSLHRLKREEEAIDEFHNALQYNPTGPLAENIREQMSVVERSIRGFSGGLSYIMSYDNNSNLDDNNPVAEFRTDVSPLLIYRYKAKNGLRWLLSTAPVYSSYHKGQYDFLNTNSTISASVSKQSVTLGAGINYQVARGLINSQRSSNSTTYYGEWIARFKSPLIIHPWQAEWALTNASVNASYTILESLGSPFYSAYKYSLLASFNQPVAERTVLNLNYRADLSENMHVVGSDYAYRDHGLDFRLERGVAAGISVSAGYSVTLLNYLYPDSASGYTSYRHNRSHAATVGVSYQSHPSLRFFANLSRSLNHSNLPAGIILNAQDVIEGLQSPSLGDYSRTTLTAGVILNL